MSCKTNGGIATVCGPRGTFCLSAKRQPAPSPEHVLTCGRPLDQVAQSDVVKVSIKKSTFVHRVDQRNPNYFHLTSPISSNSFQL